MDKARLTVVDHLYFQQFGEEPIAVPFTSSRWLEGDEQPYTRKLKAGPSWEKLDKGWIENPGMLLLCNDAGKKQTVRPTKEEAEYLAKQIIEVGVFSESGIFLFHEAHPGDPPLRLCCPREVWYSVRAKHAAYSPIPFSLTIFPR